MRDLPPAADRARVLPDFPADAPDMVARALAEDLGDGDATAAATIPADARAQALIRQKAPGVVYGNGYAELAFHALDPGAKVRAECPEGVWQPAGTPVLHVHGNARALLAAERTALNFLGRLSGIATLTARCVGEVEGTGARILDTRKTTPGLRLLEKAAVAAGGATNHRVGLYDAILIKENHIAAAGGVTAAVHRARVATRHRLSGLHVEREPHAAPVWRLCHRVEREPPALRRWLKPHAIAILWPEKLKGRAHVVLALHLPPRVAVEVM